MEVIIHLLGSKESQEELGKCVATVYAQLIYLRTRGSVQSAFLFCCRLLLCVSMAGCSIVGSSPADWGTITQVYLNNLSTVGTLQLNDARSGSHFIKNAPVAFRATLYNFDFIRVRFHSIRSSSSISTRTRL